MKLFFTCSFLLIFSPTFLQAQVNRCATNEHEIWLKMSDNSYAQNRKKIDDFTEAYIQKNKKIQPNSKLKSIITIPVVVHIIYHTDEENLSDERVLSQIAILNADYRHMNADTIYTPDAFKPLAADCEIEFCLASTAPNGDGTSGITRTYTEVASWVNDDRIKHKTYGGDDAWPADRYLNIWVCNFSSDLLGYAQYPGGSPFTDGIVITYQAFGLNPDGFPYGTGRTATHETGHWLNLYHVWGDDFGCGASDSVDDTPNQKIATYGCPTFPRTDMCTPDEPGYMFMNYMDYSDDLCMNIFTQGQSERMHALFEPEGFRYALLSSPGCNVIVLQQYDAQTLQINFPATYVCDTHFEPIITIKNHGSETLTSLDIHYAIDGGTPSIFNWSGTLNSYATSSVTLPEMIATEGMHILHISVSNPNGHEDLNADNDSLHISFTVITSGATLPLQQSFEDALFPYPGYIVNNPDGLNTWLRTTDAASLGTASIVIDQIHNDHIGAIDDIILPACNTASTEAPTLAFDLAYALYDDASSDTLEAWASDNCGLTWSMIYKKFGHDLMTTPSIVHDNFIPEISDWRTEYIDLSAWKNDALTLKFSTTSGHGNNLYIDNINITGNVAIQTPLSSTDIQLFPNPTSDIVHMTSTAFSSSSITVNIYNVLGEIVLAKNIHTVNTDISIAVGHLQAGYYRIELNTNTYSVSKAFIKQ